MVKANRTDTTREVAGRRLERYIKEQWPRGKGGIRGLAAAIGASAETIYSWFRGETEPSMSHLREVAAKLSTTRSVLVAVLDGETTGIPDPVEVRLRAVEAELQSLRARRGGAASPRRSVPGGTAG